MSREFDKKRGGKAVNYSADKDASYRGHPPLTATNAEATTGRGRTALVVAKLNCQGIGSSSSSSSSPVDLREPRRRFNYSKRVSRSQIISIKVPPTYRLMDFQCLSPSGLNYRSSSASLFALLPISTRGTTSAPRVAPYRCN